MKSEDRMEDMKLVDVGGLYALGEHWKSELDFFTEEIRFLDSLIGKHFVFLLKDEGDAAVKEMTTKLKNLDLRREEFSLHLKAHQKSISGEMKEERILHGSHITKAHENLEKDFALLFRDYKKAKKEVFKHVEHTLSSEKVKRLLTS
jgi:hypothetical protein